MSNIISIDYLLQFLIFIYIIPVSITIESKIQFAFLNGFNVIRCSDQQVQVYLSNDKVLSEIMGCENKDDIHYNQYAGFQWGSLKLICSSDDSTVHEEQFIKRKLGGDKIEHIPDAVGQLAQSTESYELQVEHGGSFSKFDKISSIDQSTADGYFNENAGLKERRIYVRFPDYLIICRIKFSGEESNPCPSMHDQAVNDVDYACYYNPGGEQEPTIEEMEAELKQVEAAEKPEDSEAYVLDVERPKNTPIDSSDTSLPDSKEDTTQPDSNEDTSKPPPKPSNPSNKPPVKPNHSPKKPPAKQPAPKGASKPKEKQNTPKMIGLILGILLLILLIGSIGFYMIRKHRQNQSASTSSTNIEHGNDKHLSSLVPNESQQSISVASANDTNTEISMNIPTKKGKPTVELQAQGANKRQRTGTSMIFNEDI